MTRQRGFFLTCDVDKSFIPSQCGAVLLSGCSTRTVTSLQFNLFALQTFRHVPASVIPAITPPTLPDAPLALSQFCALSWFPNGLQ